MSPWKGNRGDGDERVEILALPFRNVGLRTPKVVDVFLSEQVPVDTWPGYVAWNFGDGPSSEWYEILNEDRSYKQRTVDHRAVLTETGFSACRRTNLVVLRFQVDSSSQS